MTKSASSNYWPGSGPSEAAKTETLKALCTEFKKRRITRVAIPYDGYGDEGTIQDAQAFRKDKPVPLPSDLAEALDRIAEDWLPYGWENDQGAYGELILDVPEAKLTRAHHWRVETTEYEEEEFSL